MSLPASAPAGLSVASLRDGLRRGAGAALPALRRWVAGAAPGEYRSAFPARLRLARIAIAVLASLWLAASLSSLDATRNIVQIVGHDTVPSVNAAGTVQTGLARINEDLANIILSGDNMNDFYEKAMRSHLLAVRAALLDAAYNVTYGDEEREPIRIIIQSLGDFEETVGRAIASETTARRDLAFIAADVLDGTTLPAAAKLAQVNVDHLEKEYRAYHTGAVLAWLAVAALLLAFLVAVQVDIARTARRLLNPGLAIATLAIVAATALMASRTQAAHAELRIAKEAAFDSLYALSNARAAAANADAAQTFAIVAGEDGARAQRYRDAFEVLAHTVLGIDASEVGGAIAKHGAVPGYLGSELSNTTFEGEKAAADEAVAAWGVVRDDDRQMMHKLLAGDRAAVVRSETWNDPDSIRENFKKFDLAIVKLQNINQNAFAASVAAAERDDAPLGVALVLGFVVAAAAGWLGIRQRLDAYRF